MRVLTIEEAKRSEARLWSKVRKSEEEGGCWEWIGYRSEHGYGSIGVISQGQYGLFQTHRLSYLLAHGSIPKGMFICHKCDNPPCCNPDHLFAGTPRDNTQDMLSKGRECRVSTQVGEQHNAAILTEDQVRQIRVEYVKYNQRRSNINELAERFHVKPATIHGVVDRRIWKHVI